MRAKIPRLRIASGLSASPAEGKRGGPIQRGAAPAAPHLQPKESAPFDWLHFVEITPLVGQPELSAMHVHSSEAPLDAHAAGTALQADGFQAIAALS